MWYDDVIKIYYKMFSLDRNLVQERPVLDCVHIQMELLILPSVTHQVALVGSNHNVLEFLGWEMSLHSFTS